MNAHLRYHGAKWRLAPRIIELLPPHQCYVEPFGGSAAVLLNKPRSDVEVYNDIDSIVVRFFRVLRDQPEQLALQVALTPFAREENALSFQDTPDDLEAARRFVVRCWQTRSAFRRGGGNTSWVYQRSLGHWTESRAFRWSKVSEALLDVAERIQSVYIENDDWKGVVKRFDAPGTLFYLDPPYMAKACGRSWERYRHDMPEADEHVELLETITKVKGMVVLSGYTSELYNDVLNDWSCVRIAARDAHNNQRIECVWRSPNIKDFQQSINFNWS